MVPIKISKALRGSWALPDARSIGAAIDRVGGAHNSNCAKHGARGGSFGLFLHQKTSKRGRNPSILSCNIVGPCKQLISVGEVLFGVKEAPAVAATHKYIAISAVK